MLKAYYYFIFRVFKFYMDKYKESEDQALFSSAAVSALVVSFIMIFIAIWLNYFQIISDISNSIVVISSMLIIGFVNYYMFIKGKRFLLFGFVKDKIGGFKVVMFIAIILFLTVFSAKINSDRLLQERPKKSSKYPQRESLEGNIREWLK